MDGVEERSSGSVRSVTHAYGRDTKRDEYTRVVSLCVR